MEGYKGLFGRPKATIREMLVPTCTSVDVKIYGVMKRRVFGEMPEASESKEVLVEGRANS